MDIIDKIYCYLENCVIDQLYEKRYFFIKDLLEFNELGTILYFDNEQENYYFYNKLFHILNKKYLIFFVSLFIDKITLLPNFIVDLCIFYDIYQDELQFYYYKILDNDSTRVDIYKRYTGILPRFWELYRYLELDYYENYNFVYENDSKVIYLYEQHNNIPYTLQIDNSTIHERIDTIYLDNELSEKIEYIDDKKDKINENTDIIEYLIYKCSCTDLDYILDYFGEELIWRLISNPKSSDYSLFLYEYYISNKTDIIKN